MKIFLMKLNVDHVKKMQIIQLKWSVVVYIVKIVFKIY